MEETRKKTKRWLKILANTLFVLLIVLCGVVIYFNVTHEYYDVVGPSMAPTINNGVTTEEQKKDGVFVSKIKGYVRGDIIVALHTEGNETYNVIKRVIALSGDKLKISEIDGCNRIVLVKSGQSEEVVVDESYLTDYSINVNLKNEFDSMVSFKQLPLDDDGFITIPEGHIFYLGDNRDESKDCADYGPINKNLVVGKVDYIIYGNTNPYGQVIQQFFGW